MKEVAHFTSVIGYCYVSVPSEDDLHEFGLFNGEDLIETGYFKSLTAAKESAMKWFPDCSYVVKDMDVEWELNMAMRYRKRIRELHPSFKKTNIVLDMSEMYYNRTPEHWYTFIPFSYNGKQFAYRETASTDWISNE